MSVFGYVVVVILLSLAAGSIPVIIVGSLCIAGNNATLDAPPSDASNPIFDYCGAQQRHSGVTMVAVGCMIMAASLCLASRACFRDRVEEE